MKRLSFLCLLLILVTGCSPATTPPPDTSTPEIESPGEGSVSAIEPETEPESVFIEAPLSYEVIEVYEREDVIIHQTSTEIGGIGSAEDTWEEPIFIAGVTIQNTDSASGTFKITFSVVEPFDDFFLTKEAELAPGETFTAECPAYILGDWSYEVTPSTKLVEQS